MYTKSIENKKDISVDVKTITYLAQELGLACVERTDCLTVIGERQLIVFKILEENICQIKEIC